MTGLSCIQGIYLPGYVDRAWSYYNVEHFSYFYVYKYNQTENCSYQVNALITGTLKTI